METLSDSQDAHIKTTSHNMLRQIRPYLESEDMGQFVKGLLEEELTRHELQSLQERIGPLPLCAIVIVALLAGFAIGSL